MGVREVGFTWKAWKSEFGRGLAEPIPVQASQLAEFPLVHALVAAREEALAETELEANGAPALSTLTDLQEGQERESASTQ